MNRYNGFTLLESMLSLAILMTLTSIAVPSFLDLTIKLRVDKEISILYRLLLITRNTAINSGIDTTLCPLVNNACTDDWSLPLYVFLDKNNNKQFEPQNNEKFISMKEAISVNDKLQYGKNRVGITYTATGHLSGWGQNGTFKYCPKNHMEKSRGVVVATSGRVYKSYQSSTGKDKNRSGTIIICS